MPKTLTQMLQQMVAEDGADLFISVGTKPTIRGGRGIYVIEDRLISEEDALDMAGQIMSERQKQEFFKTNEMNMAFQQEESGRFRVSIFRQKGQVGMVIRQVKTEVPTIDDLKLPEIFKQLITLPRGLILVTGATGSGKSTSLAAMIDHRNRNLTGHIMTLEDPIEFVHQHRTSIVNQREIGLDTEDYHTGLKNVLRQAPDVILIGEIRDAETMEHAMMYAETGHLVLSTLHSLNANQTLDRITQFFPMEMEQNVHFQLANILRAIISQRLVRTSDGQGRVAVIEIMIASPRIRELIAKGDIGEIKQSMEQGVQDGMQTFDLHLLRLYNQGIVTREDALKAADSPGDLNLRMQGLTTGNLLDRLILSVLLRLGKTIDFLSFL
ncbi:MAG: PilT/PilU family type 4a pilus ATPase [Candidatus Omnitrophica bacterium]|nr:PilT/PilU family type 4a pilus ATPase [Candidatus Omnitrophota bacterium]